MRRLAELAIPLLLVLIWEGLVRFDLLPGHLYATPSGTVRRLIELTAAGELWATIKASLGRVAGGFLLGAVPGLLAGLTLTLFPPVRTALKPAAATWAPALQAALVPLLLLLLIPGQLAPLKVIAAGVFLLMLVSSVAGVLSIDQRYLDAGQSFGASRRDFFLTIALPGAAAPIFAGLKRSACLALLLTAAAEMMYGRNGIGYLLWTAYRSLDLNGIAVGMLLLALLGLVTVGALALLERKVMPWKQ